MGNVVLKPTRLPVRGQGNTTRLSPAPKHRKPRGKKYIRGLLVVVGAMLLTTYVIRASETFSIPGQGLIGGVGASVPPLRCPEDMVFISGGDGGFCIDRYEASAGKLCPHSSPENQFDTNGNLDIPTCLPVSVADVEPWVNVPQSQAMELCARAGKHLATNAEWYRAALGTPDDVNTSDGCVLGHIDAVQSEHTGSHSKCVSSYGAYDMVGNVWEWVDGTITDGTYGSRKLPNEGFVTEADNDGVPVSTGTSSDPVFHNDYFSLITSGVQGMLRGGYWNMTEKAGINAINAATAPSFVGNAVGFRCAR